MATFVEATSTLTDQFQTTIPDAVRQVLGLEEHDEITYTIYPDGTVVPTRAAAERQDPVRGHFLKFLERDITGHPESLVAIDASLVERATILTAGTDIDLQEPLSPRDE